MSIWLIGTPLGQRTFTHAPTWTSIEKQNCQCRPDNLKRHRKAPHGLRIMCENHTKVAIQSSQYAALALFRRVQTATYTQYANAVLRLAHAIIALTPCPYLLVMVAILATKTGTIEVQNPLPTPCQDSLASDSKYL